MQGHVHAQALRIFLRQIDGLDLDIRGRHFARGSAVRDSQGHASGTGGQVEHAGRGHGRVEVFDRRLDQVFGLRPRHQHRRSHEEFDREEFPEPGNVGNGFETQAALDECFEARCRDPIAEPRQQTRAGHSQRMRQQKFGIEARGVGDGLQAARGLLQALRQSRGFLD